MPTTTISATTFTDENGVERTQYRTTVPKGLAESFDLAGAEVEWSAESGNTLSITRVER